MSIIYNVYVKNATTLKRVEVNKVYNNFINNKIVYRFTEN